jgi:hypothetical protein
MTAAVARLATDQDHRLVDGYARYCQNLIDAGVMTDRARRDRLRLARQFLDQHPDLDGWKARPLRAAAGSAPGEGMAVADLRDPHRTARDRS